MKSVCPSGGYLLQICLKPCGNNLAIAAVSDQAIATRVTQLESASDRSPRRAISAAVVMPDLPAVTFMA